MILFFCFILFFSNHAWANKTYQDALGERYAGCKLDKEIIYLTPQHVTAIEKKTGSKVYSKIQLRFLNHCTQNYIYVDSHIVRTLNETLILDLDNEKLVDLEIVSFLEPQAYKAPRKWISKNIIGKGQKDNFSLGQGVDSLSGATLSAKALSQSASRILTLNMILKNDEK